MRIAPRSLDTGTAVLFMAGSALFALGSVPAYVDAVGATADALTYAAGSVLFTAAALAQLLPARDLDRVAAWVQLPGTVCFNVSTFAVLLHNLTVAEEDHRIWRPDVYGSVLFLVASAIGVVAAGRVLELRPRAASWWIAWLNLAGSVAFMFSALGSYVLPASGAELDTRLTVGGTFVGAVLFLAGAALMPVSWRQQTGSPTTTLHPKAGSR